MAPRTKTAGTETESKAVKPAAEKTAALKATTEKKATAKKAPAKTTTAKKATTAKKTTTKTKTLPKIEAEIQFDGKSVNQEVLLQRIYDAWTVTGHDKDSIKSINIYLKPAEDRAYYVINESENGSIFMF